MGCRYPADDAVGGNAMAVASAGIYYPTRVRNDNVPMVLYLLLLWDIDFLGLGYELGSVICAVDVPGLQRSVAYVCAGIALRG